MASPLCAAIFGTAGAGGEHDGIRSEAPAFGGFGADGPATFDHRPRRALIRHQHTAERGEFLEKHADQRRKIDPALARIEDRALRRDRAGIDAGRDAGDLGRRQPPRIVAERHFVAIGRVDLVALVIGIPGQAAVEAEPSGIRVSRRKRAVAVDAGHAQPVIGQ